MTLSSVQWAIRTQAGDAIADIASTSAHRITKQNMIDALYQEEYEIPQVVLTRIGIIESAFNGLSNKDVKFLLLSHLDSLRNLSDSDLRKALARARQAPAKD